MIHSDVVREVLEARQNDAEWDRSLIWINLETLKLPEMEALWVRIGFE